MQNLQALSSAVLASSKKKDLYLEYCHYVMLFLAAVSIFTSEKASIFFALLMAVSELFIITFSVQANRKKKLGQNLLRANILSNSFGLQQSLELSYLKASVTEDELFRSSDYEVSNYYSSGEGQYGEHKLKSMLSESCFWSQFLYAKEKKLAGNFLICYSIFFAVILLAFIYFDFFSEEFSLSRLIILLLTCVPLKNKIMDYFRFRDGEQELNKLDFKLENTGNSLGELMIVWSDYCVITSYTPLISDKTYQENNVRLNKIWNERIQVQ